MKGGCDRNRTKVVLRHLPPTVSRAILLDQIDGAFAGRYSWISFCPGKSSQQLLSYSRAYIDFKRPEDVIEFAEFFDGHAFVNEKGTLFKVIVEYAPSQRVPKHWSKKDSREGTIHKDSEYLEFLELLAKPVENLPSAEIQLERRGLEQSGAAKDTPIVTPLMDFVRQKRAAKGGCRKSLTNGKVGRKASASSIGSRSSATSRQSSGKKRLSTPMYVIRDPGKSVMVKDKSTFILVSKQGDQHLSDKTTIMASSEGNQAEDEGGVAVTNLVEKKKVLLLRGRERDGITLPDSDGMQLLQQHAVVSSAKTAAYSTALKQNQHNERIIRSILSNKGSCQSQSSRLHSEQHIQMSNLEKEKRPPRHLHVQAILKGMNGASEDKISGNDLHGYGDRQDKRVRHKDKPDRGGSGIWTNRSNSGDEYLPSSGSSQVDSLEDMKQDVPNARSGELKTHGSGQTGRSSENGFGKHLGRHGLTHGVKDVDGYSNSSEGKHPRRSSSSVHGSYEKQVWVQKASSGS